MIRFSLLALAACSSSPHVPDADVCSTCTPAATCGDNACNCPMNFVPAQPMFVTGVVVKNLPQIPGLLAAIGQFDDAGQRYAELVAYDPTQVPVGVDIDVAIATAIKVGFGYQIDANQQIKSSFRAVTGTLRVTSVCPEGVAGTLANATLDEIDVFTSLDPIAGGCTLALPSVTFAIAGACK